MRISSEAYAELIRRKPHLAPASTIRRNQVGVTALPATDKKPAKRRSLVNRVPREETSGPRFEIVFTVYATRPADWDGYSIKECQDLLVRIGILPDDSWRTLEGRVRSAKAEREEDCKTIIEIKQL